MPSVIKNQYYVQYNYADYIQQTERQAKALESAERSGGSAALTDCDVKMVVVLELRTQLSLNNCPP